MDKLFFSGSEPQLLNEKALKSLNKIFENNITETKTTGEHIITLYNEYIRPNLFALLILIIVCVFLFIRYIIKKYNVKNKDEIDIEIDKEIDKEINKELNKELEKQKNDEINKYKKDDLTDIDKFTISSKDKDNSNESDNRSRFTELNEEYNKAVKENLGNISEQALKDIYKKKKDKFTFDELTRIIVEGS